MLPITFMALIDNEGDKELFRHIYDTYRTMLLGYAYKITNDVSLAEDAVSEAFLRLAKSFNNVHNFEVTKIASYTVIIVRNVCYDLLKSNDSDLTYIDEISSEEPETAVEDATVKQLLNSAVNDLPEIYKDSIILRYYYELSIAVTVLLSVILLMSFSCYKASADFSGAMYSYTRSVSAKLVLSGTSLTGKTEVQGYYGETTKIEITQVLELDVGLYWFPLVIDSQTTYSDIAVLTKNYGSCDPGTYRLRSDVTVYAGSNSESITKYTTTKL